MFGNKANKFILKDKRIKFRTFDFLGYSPKPHQITALEKGVSKNRFNFDFKCVNDCSFGLSRKGKYNSLSLTP
jgi:hypothetical protein